MRVALSGAQSTNLCEMPTHRVVSIEELSQYLHLPEKAVAKELGICLTSLKKLCRGFGITRWPYRKLKSLDKKIAKAENGTSAPEDPATLKARAEDLKREKMKVAFTYGLKPTLADMDAGEKAVEAGASTPLSEISDTPPDVSDMLLVEGMLVAEISKAVANPTNKADGGKSDCVLRTPASIMAKSLPHVWSTYANRDSPTSIPTPPEADSIDTVGEEVDCEMLAEAAQDVMASNALLEDSRMNSYISWEAPTLDDSLVDEIPDAAPDCDTGPSLTVSAVGSQKKGATFKCSTAGKTAAVKVAADKSAHTAKGRNGKATHVLPSDAAGKGTVQQRGLVAGCQSLLPLALACSSALRPSRSHKGSALDGNTMHLALHDDQLTEDASECGEATSRHAVLAVSLSLSRSASLSPSLSPLSLSLSHISLSPVSLSRLSLSLSHSLLPRILPRRSLRFLMFPYFPFHFLYFCERGVPQQNTVTPTEQNTVIPTNAYFL